MTGVGTSLAALFLLNAQGLLTSVLQVSFRMPSAAGISMIIVITLFVLIAIGKIASLWPAYRSNTMKPYDSIRGEGQ
jgi:ABC-type antimicrobial peptide transport system permease subunit